MSRNPYELELDADGYPVPSPEMEAANATILGQADLNNKQIATELLDQALPIATMSIVRLAQHGSTEKLRFDASKYIIERIMGRPTAQFDIRNTGERDVFESIMEGFVSQTDDTNTSQGPKSTVTRSGRPHDLSKFDSPGHKVIEGNTS